MTNRVGELRLAATVWPISTRREITMPSMGAKMLVRSRSTLARSTLAWRVLTTASAWLWVALAWSNSDLEIKLAARRSLERAKLT